MTKLNIGVTSSGRQFTLPFDAALQKFALMGISGSGKSSTATVMAEEMCKANLPWIALDPVSVWWGLRSNRDGSPGGHPVVVFGGDHGDLPLEKGAGAKIAEALVTESVFAVIDRAGAELAADAEYAPLIRKAARAAGVDAFGEASLQVRVEGVTEPGEQWRVAGELRRRLKLAFDAEGISLRP